jgi:nuclear GTP-binding protein
MTKKAPGAGKAGAKGGRSPGGRGGGSRGGSAPGGAAGPRGTPKHSMDPVGRPKGGAGGQRSEATVRRLAMYKQRPVRDAKGKVLFEQYQSKAAPNTRIVPDRRWFGNTRVVGQAALEEFRNEMAATSGDAYTVVLKGKSLPLALLADPEKAARPARARILGAASFADTFGAKAQRKRPAPCAESYEELLSKVRRGARGVGATWVGAAGVAGRRGAWRARECARPPAARP